MSAEPAASDTAPTEITMRAFERTATTRPLYRSSAAKASSPILGDGVRVFPPWPTNAR